MIKISSQKSVLLIAFLALFLIFGVCVPLTPTVSAATPDSQTKTLDVLSNVLGLNTQTYTLTQTSQLNNQYISLPEKEDVITLVSNQSSLKADCSFVNNNLRLLYLSDYSGEPSLKQQAANTVEMANGFLVRYQAYVKDSFYGTLASTLNTVNENVNSTEVHGNVKLAISNFDQKTVDYTWTYIDNNGTEAAAKNVILSYYNGKLQCFLNNWPLYTVVTNTPKISLADATAIAIQASKSFSYNITTDNETQTVSGFKISPASLTGQTLSYLNFPDQSSARQDNPFTLYPSWYVQLGFDKFYPGDVTGMTVTVWADTGQVSSMYQTVCDIGSQLTAYRGSTISTTSTLSTPILVAIASLITVLLIVKKRSVLNAMANRKVLAIPLTVMLCLGSVSGLVLWSLPKVSADTPNSLIGASQVYGITRGSGMPDSEQAAGAEVTNYIGNMTVNDGYATDNLYGDSTIYSTVYGCMASTNYYYGQVASFYFGHFSVYHQAFQDQNGDPISAYNIGLQTQGKDFFVWDWACEQASTASNPLPANWTQNPYLSNNGINFCDSSNQCFMTFDGISPEIGNTSGTFNCTAFYNVSPGPLKNFIEEVYNFALNSDYQYTIFNALNHASLDFFGIDYLDSVLNLGYTGSYYPVTNTYWPGLMHVFGDSAIQLYQPYVYLNAVDLDNSNNQLSPEFTINGEQLETGSSYYFMSDHSYETSVPSISGYQFEYFEYNGDQWCTDPADIPLWTDGTLTACYSEVTTCSLYVEAIDGYSYNTLTPNVYVDGNWAGTATMLIHVTPGYHTITVDDPTYNPYYWYDESLVAIIDGNYNQYYNGQSIPIYSDTSIFAWYGTY